MHDKNSTYQRQEILETHTVLALACLILGHLLQQELLLGLAVGLLFVSLFWHGLAEKINRLWLELSRRLGHFSSSLLLGICFYCLLTPLAWLYRIFHPDDLDLRKGKESYFHKHTVEFDQNYFERLW